MSEKLHITDLKKFYLAIRDKFQSTYEPSTMSGSERLILPGVVVLHSFSEGYYIVKDKKYTDFKEAMTVAIHEAEEPWQHSVAMLFIFKLLFES